MRSSLASLCGLPHAVKERRVLAQFLGKCRIVELCDFEEVRHKVLNDGDKALLYVRFDSLEQLYFVADLIPMEGSQHEELLLQSAQI